MNNTSCMPRSCVHWSYPLWGGFAVVLSYAAFSGTRLTNAMVALLCVVVTGLVQVILELIRAPWRGTAIPDVPISLVVQRSVTKWFGMMAGVGVVLFFWWFLKNFRKPHFEPLFDLIPYGVPFVAVAGFLLILFTEWRLGPEEDSHWHWGQVVKGNWGMVDWLYVRDGALGWLVKGIFLPYNFCGIISFIKQVRGTEHALTTYEWSRMINSLDSMVFMAIVIAITPGYFFSSRLLGTAIKSVDRTWFGWMVTLFCYAPFNSAVSALVSMRRHIDLPVDQQPWQVVFDNTGYFLIFCGIWIIFFELIHFWGEAIFGLRASNLTNRGIITNGPYRHCRHPIYVSKIFVWVVLFAPYAVGPTFIDNFRYSLMFLAWGGIFYMRAWVEERLLASDPVYVEYALWVDQHGIFSWLGRICPYSTFAWRYQYWKKQGLI